MSQGRVKIIDYGVGNLRSVEQAFVHEGIDATFVSTAEEISCAERLVLPGVGAFGDGMAELHKRGLVSAIKDYATSGRPFLGICLGMQLMFDSSEESVGVQGLGIFHGTTTKYDTAPCMKVPQIGWNCLRVTPGSRLLSGCDESFVYFVHSYHVRPIDSSDIAARSDYSCEFVAAVERGSVGGCQFHPEKSQNTGLRIMRNFLLF